MSDLDLETTFRGARDLVARTLVLAYRALQFWPALAICAAVGAGAAYVAPKIVRPVYETYATLIYQETVDSDTVLKREVQADRWIQMSTRFRDVVMARTNLAKIINDLGLYPSIVESQSVVQAAEEMQQNLVILAREGRSLSVTFRYHEPEKAHAVLERIIEDLKKQPGAYDADQSQGTKKFLEAQLESLTRELRAKEKEAATFLVQHPEFALDEFAVDKGQAGATVRAQKKGATAPTAGGGAAGRLAALTRQADRLKQSIEQVNPAAPAPKPVLSEADEQKVAEAQARVTEAKRELSLRLESLTDRHPDVAAQRREVQQAEATLARVKAAAKPITPKVAKPKETPAQTKKRLEDELQKVQRAMAVEAGRLNRENKGEDGNDAAADVDPTAQSVVDLETKWVSLNRELHVARERHEDIEGRLFSATTAASIESGGAGQMLVIDPPFEPTRPSARGPRRTSAVVLALFLVLGVLIAMFLALVDDTMYDERDAERLDLGPIAMSIPKPRPRLAEDR